MDDGDPQLGPDHGAGNCRIDVAHDDNGVGTVAHTDGFVGNHRAAGLFRVCAAPDLEVMRRLRQTQIPEERVRHICVVVLSGVHYVRCAPLFSCEGVIQRRDFHEVRTRRGDQVNALKLQVLLPLRAVRAKLVRSCGCKWAARYRTAPWLGLVRPPLKVTPELTCSFSRRPLVCR